MTTRPSKVCNGGRGKSKGKNLADSLVDNDYEELKDLATTNNYSLLNVDGFAFEVEPQDNKKIDIVFGHVSKNFKQSIPLDEIFSTRSESFENFLSNFNINHKISGKHVGTIYEKDGADRLDVRQTFRDPKVRMPGRCGRLR